MTQLRAFIAGMTHETNTFSPIPTSAENFAAETYRPGGATGAAPPDFDTLGYGYFARLCAEAGIEVCAGLFTHAGPSAALSARDHILFKSQILEDLERAMPVDRVFLFMHGAQIAQGCDDVEGDLVSAVRARVGPDVPIALLLDLHANVTPDMLRHATFTVGCLAYPHTDYAERAAHAFTLVDSVVRGALRPHTQAWRIPLVGLYRTTEGPMKDFVQQLRLAQSQPGILSISAFHGFFLGDTRHTGASLVVVSDETPAGQGAAAIGERLAAQFIEAVMSTPVAPGMEAALSEALHGDDGPVVLADSGDNPGGGGAGGAPDQLEALLARNVRNAAFGMLWDPVAADFAHRAGVGATLQMRLGGKVSHLSGRPLDVLAEVTCVRDDARQAWFAQGEPKAALGRSAALKVAGIDIVVNSDRQQVFDPRCFSEHGIDVRTRRIVVVKGSTHFAHGFAPLASRIVYCSSPGSVSLDPTLFAYHHIRRPLYPLDAFRPVAEVLRLDAP